MQYLHALFHSVGISPLLQLNIRVRLGPMDTAIHSSTFVYIQFLGLIVKLSKQKLESTQGILCVSGQLDFGFEFVSNLRW